VCVHPDAERKEIAAVRRWLRDVLDTALTTQVVAEEGERIFYHPRRRLHGTDGESHSVAPQ
jgi:hypothetical protein